MKCTDLKTAKIAFIGAGNMAEALISGLVSGEVCMAASIVVSDIRPERLSQLQDAYKVSTASNNLEAARDADAVVLATKPQQLPDVLSEIAPALSDSALLISIAAGIPTGKIEASVGSTAAVVRVMPNTPALVGKGAAAICAGANATADDLDVVEAMMQAVGLVVRVDEAQMDAVTAVSGSGPAYVFLLIEGMLKAAQELGLPEAEARKLVLSTVSGAAELCEKSGDDPAVLRERVTSKGGTTAAALEVLMDGGAPGTLVKAIQAAEKRSKELSAG